MGQISGIIDGTDSGLKGNVEINIWGSLHGHYEDHHHVSRPDRYDLFNDEEYCMYLYQENGLDFVEQINGSFCGVIRSPDRVSLFVDRLGSRPLFVRETESGVAYSTHLTDVVKATSSPPVVDPVALAEYIVTNRTMGVSTLFEGIERVHPGTVLSYTADGDRIEEWQYWQPKYEPNITDSNVFIEEFDERLNAVTEDVTTSGSIGLMLSGGSDARAILSYLSGSVECYHISDWMSREARIAERIAIASDSTFNWLRRGPDYVPDLLPESARYNDFTGWFEEAHIFGFQKELDECDYLLFGLFCDALFKGHLIPKRNIWLGTVDFDLPIERPIKTPDDYVEHLLDRPIPDYVNKERLQEALSQRICNTSEGIDHHGVTYPGIEEFRYFSGLYPLTNDPDFYHFGSSIQVAPHVTPFLDYRMIDLHLSVDHDIMRSTDVVTQVIQQRSSELANIPHAYSGLPLHRPGIAHYSAGKLRSLLALLNRDNTPGQLYGHDPWPKYDALLKETGYHRESLREQADTLNQILSVIGSSDGDSVIDSTNYHEIHPLLTLVHSPSLIHARFETKL